jgi:hypothetical protein
VSTRLFRILLLRQFANFWQIAVHAGADFIFVMRFLANDAHLRNERLVVCNAVTIRKDSDLRRRERLESGNLSPGGIGPGSAKSGQARRSHINTRVLRVGIEAAGNTRQET